MKNEAKQVTMEVEKQVVQTTALKNYFVRSFKMKLEGEKRENTLLTVELDALTEGRHIVLSNAK